MAPALPSPNFVAATFDLPVGSGQMHAAVPVPAAPCTATELVPSLRILSDDMQNASARQVAERGETLSCRKGCAACCRQLIPLTLFEAEALAASIRSLPPAQQRLIEDRFERALDRLALRGILPRLDPEKLPAPNSKQRQQLAIDYLALRVDCPFLEDEACTMHALRPLVCREYLVTTPSENCIAPTPETVNCIPPLLKLSQALANYSQRISGRTSGWIPLVHLFSWMHQGINLNRAPLVSGPQLLETIIRELLPRSLEVEDHLPLLESTRTPLTTPTLSQV